jgi:hypothetical protein
MSINKKDINTVDRYDSQVKGYIISSSDGDYVLHSDYQTLSFLYQQKEEELERERGKVKSILDEVYNLIYEAVPTGELTLEWANIQAARKAQKIIEEYLSEEGK